jgi:hypothetical protein
MRWTAVGLAVPLVADSLRFGRFASAAPAGDVSPANLELVTLTEDHAIVTWYTGFTGSDDGLGRMEPAVADAEVHWGTNPAHLDRISGGPSDTPYHLVELADLEPGQTYYYQAFSAGKPAPPTVFTLISGNPVGTTDDGLATGGPYAFTTPDPPPGRFLFSIALCNDLHMGETTAGLVGGTPITGIQQEPGLPPYPEVMLESLVADVAAHGARYLLAAGDISAEAAPVDLSRAGQLLNQFGNQTADWLVTRGNHDRAHDGAAYVGCHAGRWQGHDCFQDRFFPSGQPGWFRQDLQGLRVLGIDTYDKPGQGNDAGALSDEQLAWFRSQLATDVDQPTLVFGHHPLVVQESPFPVTASNALDATQAATIFGDYAAMPGLFLHHAGHTHRNHRTVSPLAPNVLHQEIAAGKEYPGGFSLLRIHTEGFALNFYKTTSDQARAWSERSRQEIAGLWPQFALGSQVQDRNAVGTHDFSGLVVPDPEPTTTVAGDPSMTSPPTTASSGGTAAGAEPLAATPAFTG